MQFEEDNPLKIIIDKGIKNTANESIRYTFVSLKNRIVNMNESGRRQYIFDIYDIVSNKKKFSFIDPNYNILLYCTYNILFHPLFTTSILACIDLCMLQHKTTLASNTQRVSAPPQKPPQPPQHISLKPFLHSKPPLPREIPSTVPTIPTPSSLPTSSINVSLSSLDQKHPEPKQHKIPNKRVSSIFEKILILQDESKKINPKNRNERAIVDLKNSLETEIDEIEYYRKLPAKKRNWLAEEATNISKRIRIKEPAIIKILNLKTTNKNKDILLRNYLRLKKISERGGERSKSNTWLQTIETIPFGKKANIDKSKVKKTLQQAKEFLDSVTYGQFDVKQEMMQLMGKLLSKQNKKGLTVLAIQGPPGVGKTTLIQHGLSKILKRPFNVIPLGGAVDSSYLVGHDYTYEGSRWGRIVDSLIESKVMNPCLFFEELDKISESRKGQELMNLLMHLTDPCQVHRFQDRYFGQIDFNLSDSIIVFSLNSTKTIPRVLLDRLKVIKVKAYTVFEKIKIAQKFLIPNIMKEINIFPSNIKFSDDIVKYITEHYTSEAGVRKLKECLVSIIQELNLRNLQDEVQYPVVITESLITNDIFAKKQQITYVKVGKQDQIGYCCGLWANAYEDGGICQIEVSLLPKSKPLELELTGSQGKVMQESMHCARTVAWELLNDAHKVHWMKRWENGGNTGFHIHVPSGAVPKDGPSAGVAITLALLSILTNLPIKKDAAFTGEIKLRGLVGKIGGLQAKLTGATRAGVKVVGFPENNSIDLQNIHKDIYCKLVLNKLSHIRDAIDIAFDNKINDYLTCRPTDGGCLAND